MRSERLYFPHLVIRVSEMTVHPPYLVAVVEDDPGLLADLVDFLTLRGFDARGFESAEAFFQAWFTMRFDLLLLDVSLPGINGLEVAQRVRVRDTAGIVILTALDSDESHVLGLDAGADMFLSKRSSLEVIEAACLSVLRRVNMRDDGQQSPGGRDVWRIDSRRWRLHVPNKTSVDLTQSEVMLLTALFEKPGQTIAREELLAHLDKPDSLSNLRNLDNATSRIRRKVQEACGMEFPLRTGYGKGYIFTGLCEVLG